MSKQEKQVVHYAVGVHTYIRVGERALVVPVDHPDTENVSNGQYANTSEVLSYDPETGEFETKNTLYKPEGIAQQAETEVE